jgi:hypothetical protein
MKYEKESTNIGAMRRNYWIESFSCSVIALFSSAWLWMEAEGEIKEEK